MYGGESAEDECAQVKKLSRRLINEKRPFDAYRQWPPLGLNLFAARPRRRAERAVRGNEHRGSALRASTPGGHVEGGLDGELAALLTTEVSGPCALVWLATTYANCTCQ